MTSPKPSPKDPITEPDPWNAVAGGYDEELFHQLPELTTEAVKLMNPAPGATVLDVATGPGSLAIRLSPRVARVVAVDFAEKMIDRLRAHTAEAGITNIEAHVMDAHALAFEAESFDAVASMFGWFLFADRPRALLEMYRVLRPGGRLLVTSWSTLDRNTLLGAGLQAIRAALPDLPRPSGPLPTQVPEVCAGELRAAGFKNVTTKIVTAPVSLRSTTEFWRSYERAGAPIAVLRKKLGEAAWTAAAERAQAHLRTSYGDGPFTLQAEAIYSSGVR